MESERKPAYWAVLPAKVRYDGDLRPNAKLLYAEITALASASGYCWATNEYLAGLFEIKARTVSDLIGTLSKKGYLRVEVVRDPATNEVTERRLWIDIMGSSDALPPIAKNGYTPPAENGDTPIAKNDVTPIAKNGYKNNLKDINIPPIVPQGGRKRRQPKEQPDWKPERFAKFWDFYRTNTGRGESKQAAIRAWDKLKPDDALIVEMGLALMEQINSEQWKSGFGIPYASTWLNNRRWTDTLRQPIAPDNNAGGGYAPDREVL